METKVLNEYVKDNNINGYLSNDLDSNNLQTYIKNNPEEIKKFEEEKSFNDNVDTLEDYIYCLIENYNFELAIQNEDIKKMLYYIYCCEFDLEINKNGTLNLIDLQNAYLGGTESYINFETIDSALGRLSGSYLYDYFGIEV